MQYIVIWRSIDRVPGRDWKRGGGCQGEIGRKEEGARERLEERRRVPGRDWKRGGGCQGEIAASQTNNTLSAWLKAQQGWTHNAGMSTASILFFVLQCMYIHVYRII